MTLAVRTRIFQAYKTALDLIAPQNLAGPVTVYRSRRLPLDGAARLMVNLIASDSFDADDTISSDGTRYTEPFTVEGLVTAAADGVTSDLADVAVEDDLTDLYAATVVALMADTQLGGLVIDTRQTGAVFDLTREEGSQPSGSFELSMEVDYNTAMGDPYTEVA